MSESWAFTSLDVADGRFSGVESGVDAGGIESWFDRAVAGGLGYCEFHAAGSEFPAVSISLRGRACVFQASTAPERMLILVGDASADPNAVFDDFPVQGELGAFTGEYLLSVEAGRAALGEFLHSGQIDEMGKWDSL